MALQFDPSAYASIFNAGQARQGQAYQNTVDSLNQIPQAFSNFATQQRQNQLLQLQQQQGAREQQKFNVDMYGNPSGPTPGTPGSGAGLMPSFQPQAGGGAQPTGVGESGTTPAISGGTPKPMLGGPQMPSQPGQGAMGGGMAGGSPIVAAWNSLPPNHPFKPSGQPSMFGGDQSSVTTQTPGTPASGRPLMPYEIQQAELQRTYKQHQMEDDPNSPVSQSMAAVLGSMLPKGSNLKGMNATTMKDMLGPVIEKYYSAQMMGSRINNQEQDKLEQDYTQMLQKELSNRAGGLGLQDSKVNTAIQLQRVLNRYYDSKTDTYNVPPSVHTDLAVGYQSLLSLTGQANSDIVSKIQQGTAQEKLNNALIYMGFDPVQTGGSTNSVLHMFAQNIKDQGTGAQQARQTYLNQLDARSPARLDPSNRQRLQSTLGLQNNFTDYLPGGQFFQQNQPGSGSPAPDAGSQMIRVKNIATGQTGQIPAQNFDSQKYQRL